MQSILNAYKNGSLYNIRMLDNGLIYAGNERVALTWMDAVVDGVPVTGKIDHMLVDEERRTIEIYDFKTGAYHKEKWEAKIPLYKYMLQLIFYKMLLNASPRFSKYRVERAHILFVTPDKDGEVHDKVYEFNEKDEAEFRKLLSAIYNMVSELSFLNDTTVFLTADKTRTVRDVKEFIKLLLAKSSG